MNTFAELGSASFTLLARMAPYMLLGIVAAGALHVWLPDTFVIRKLGGRGIRPVIRAALYGVPLPLCSCGVVPVAASLRKSGAKSGPTVSFLITTPTSGVDSILATYSLLGPFFAGARVLASFIIGLAAGVITTLSSEEAARSQPGASPPSEKRDRAVHPIKTALSYGFDELLGGMTKSLLLGTVLGGIISYWVPPGALGDMVGDGVPAYLAMMVFGIPLYVCASGSIPLAAALLAKGISPGAALVFLIAGPATNAATMGVIMNMLGKRALAIFLAAIGVGAVLFGMSMDGLLAIWPVMTPAVGSGHHRDALGVIEVAAGVALGGMLSFHLVRPYLHRLNRERKGEGTMSKIRVPDMSCNHCAGSIKKALAEVDGIKLVHADPSTKIVEVDGGEIADVLAAIRSAGFSPEVESE